MKPSDDTIRAIEAFQNLTADQCDDLRERLTPAQIARGDILVRQGELADALFLVITGRFEVSVDGQSGIVAEIGPGRPIGEIAFFTGGTRTANVRASRDSLVYKLSEADFRDIANTSSDVWPSIAASLARRLTRTTAGNNKPVAQAARTIAICPAGNTPIPQKFADQLRRIVSGDASTIVLDAEIAVREIAGPGKNKAPASVLTGDRATQWFNDLESRYERIFFIADDDLSAWSERALHQADLVVFATRHNERFDAKNRATSALEKRAVKLHRPANLKLCLIHRTRNEVTGTSRWLAERPWISMHHHVALDDDEDVRRLLRFLSGSAHGLVACGGGALTAAHIGMHQALMEAGYAFDILGGTSGGAAMTAAFAMGVTTQELEERTHDIFVKRKALRRWTWPRYGLLDHRVFDEALEEHFTNRDIEDLWWPFFAISTNLTHNTLHCHRTGPLWRAVRASAAIPALLPPVFTDDGEMLVDGCLRDNVPLKTMQSLKDGPNVVLNFALPAPEHFHIDSRDLPSRWQILWRVLTRAPKGTLPPIPGPHTVLMRSLLRSENDIAQDLKDGDVLLAPAIPDDINVLDWHRHSQLRWFAYDFARAQLAVQGAPSK